MKKNKKQTILLENFNNNIEEKYHPHEFNFYRRKDIKY